MKNDQAATLSFVVVSSSVTLIPSLNVTPASTSPMSSWPLHRRQRSWAASKSLSAIASAAFLEPAPLVTLVRSLTVAQLALDRIRRS